MLASGTGGVTDDNLNVVVDSFVRFPNSFGKTFPLSLRQVLAKLWIEKTKILQPAVVADRNERG